MPDASKGHGHMGHNDHQHGPDRAPVSIDRAFAIAIGLNVAFVLAEAISGALAGSMALVADAGHNLSDVLGLIVAWIAAVVSRRSPTRRFTYGLGASSILAALFNALFLLVAAGAIAREAVQRLQDPVPVAGATVMIVALIGILINGATALLFASRRRSDINIRGAYLHMLADAAVSAGVLVAGAMVVLTGWFWLDPIVSLVIVAVILQATWGLMRDSLSMSLQAVPSHIDADAIRAWLEGQTGVAALHDLHIWPMSTTDFALTAHLVMPGGHPGDNFLMRVTEELQAQHGITHVTLQIETDPQTQCRLIPEDRV